MSLSSVYVEKGERRTTAVSWHPSCRKPVMRKKPRCWKKIIESERVGGCTERRGLFICSHRFRMASARLAASSAAILASAAFLIGSVQLQSIKRNCKKIPSKKHKNHLYWLDISVQKSGDEQPIRSDHTINLVTETLQLYFLEKMKLE
jgi:hypothetical protein